ncbi:MAG: folylpolyglutamate synthase/dihydrofolate synthase family protein, partial [Haloplanus sp.]
MEYHEAANTLFDLRRFAPRPGTRPTEALLEHLDDPHDDVDCVQIAGSNGKGSTARMLASVLEAAGLDVGLYTSPHLDFVGERIQVNGRNLSKSALAAFVERIDPYLTETAANGDSPTFFETVTAMALWEFGRRDVDVAVLEVGIGGKLDATSAVSPVAAGLTSVTLEHTDVLGDTVEEIARDKAHVAPQDRPLVTAATGSALSAIRDEIGEVVRVGGADSTTSAEHDDPSSPTVGVEYRGRDGLEGLVDIEGPDWATRTRLALLGSHQARNAGVAVSLARQLGVHDPDVIGRGLRSAHWPGRFEVVSREPFVVLDGAHNPGACAAVGETLADFDYDDLHVVVGVMTDKDHRGIAAALNSADRVTTCRPDRARAEDQDALAAAFEGATDVPVEARSDVRDAVDAAIEKADPADAVLVVGSLYTVAEARTRWTRPVVETRVDSLPDAEAALSRAAVTEAGAW